MAEEEEVPGSCGWIDMDPPGARDRKRSKKRFSEEQVRSLENMFESQAKLDPRRKLQLAGELGLHPRQVAIWFQNKRARWKSKQMEREYGALRASYDALRSSFESLKKEKQVLTKQLQMLSEMMEERPEERLKSGASVHGGEEDHQQQPMVNISNSIEEETETHACTGAAVGGVDSNDAAAEEQLGFQHSWPSDHQPFNSSQWWEFWPMNE